MVLNVLFYTKEISLGSLNFLPTHIEKGFYLKGILMWPLSGGFGTDFHAEGSRSIPRVGLGFLTSRNPEFHIYNSY